jgi:ribosomal protein L7/L12
MDDPTLLKRLQAIEEQLAILSQAAGVPYSPPGSDLPPSVRDLVLAGKTIQAIQELRQLTGLGLSEAKAAIDQAR